MPPMGTTAGNTSAQAFEKRGILAAQCKDTVLPKRVKSSEMRKTIKQKKKVEQKESNPVHQNKEGAQGRRGGLLLNSILKRLTMTSLTIYRIRHLASSKSIGKVLNLA